eukprot:Nk52_evm10s106 gene=Nk52_evmTU10s106
MSFLKKRPSFFKRSPSSLSRSLSMASGSHKSDGPMNHNDPIFLNLDGMELVFEDGEWSSETVEAGNSGKGNEALQQNNRRLQEENQLLKYKLDILLDMLAVSNLDAIALEGELEEFNRRVQQQSRKSPVKR